MANNMTDKQKAHSSVFVQVMTAPMIVLFHIGRSIDHVRRTFQCKKVRVNEYFYDLKIERERYKEGKQKNKKRDQESCIEFAKRDRYRFTYRDIICPPPMEYADNGALTRLILFPLMSTENNWYLIRPKWYHIIWAFFVSMAAVLLTTSLVGICAAIVCAVLSFIISTLITYLVTTPAPDIIMRLSRIFPSVQAEYRQADKLYRELETELKYSSHPSAIYPITTSYCLRLLEDYRDIITLGQEQTTALLLEQRDAVSNVWQYMKYELQEIVDDTGCSWREAAERYGIGTYTEAILEGVPITDLIPGYDNSHRNLVAKRNAYLVRRQQKTQARENGNNK